MEIASRFLGMPSKRQHSSVMNQSSRATPLPSAMRTHSYTRFMERPQTNLSLYDKTFGFSNSPIKRSNRSMKHGGKMSKRRSLEVSRCSSLEQREQYRRLIAQYRTTTLKETSGLFGAGGRSGVFKAENVAKSNGGIIDLTGRTSPETVVKKPVVLREKLNKIQSGFEVKKSIDVTKETTENGDTQEILSSKLEFRKKVVLKEFISPYLAENFIPDLMKTYSRRERQRQAQTCAEETRARRLREKREAKEAILAEILHDKLKLQEEKIEEVPKLPELTNTMSDVINSALVPIPPQEVLSECFNISITREHMSTLFGLNWLNDEIINFYMELIVQRSKDQTDLPSVHAMNTFFYPRLSSQAYNSVRRWTKRVDIFAKDMVLYPIHLGVHWCLAVVDFMEKEIRYYDSMGGTNRECLEVLRDYLHSEHKNKKGSDIDLSDWQLLSMADIPQQMNGSDCGVFTCKFAEYTSLKKKLSFVQSNMPYFRKAMVWEILNKELLR